MNKKRRGFFLYILPLVVIFSLPFIPLHSSAHPLSVSYTDLTLDVEKTTLRFMIDELSLLENLPLNKNGDQHLSDQEVESGNYELGEWVGRNLLLSLFSFNLGIEVVQLLLILLFLPLLLLWQKSPFYQHGLVASSGAIVLVAAVLMTTRIL